MHLKVKSYLILLSFKSLNTLLHEHWLKSLPDTSPPVTHKSAQLHKNATFELNIKYFYGLMAIICYIIKPVAVWNIFLYAKIKIVTFIHGVTVYNGKKQGKQKFNEQPPLFITFWTGDKHLYEWATHYHLYHIIFYLLIIYIYIYLYLFTFVSIPVLSHTQCWLTESTDTSDIMVSKIPYNHYCYERMWPWTQLNFCTLLLLYSYFIKYLKACIVQRYIGCRIISQTP